MDRIKFYLDTASGGMYVDYHLFRKVLKAIHDQFDELASNSSGSSATTEFDTTELESRISTNETNISTLQSSVETLEDSAENKFLVSAEYNATDKTIEFSVASGTVVSTIDCSQFITDVGTDNDTITTVSSGDDYIAVADNGSYNYTITANLEAITADEITTIWEAI